MNFPPIPEDFVRTQIALHGAAGAAWLDRLPHLAEEFAERWSLSVSPRSRTSPTIGWRPRTEKTARPQS